MILTVRDVLRVAGEYKSVHTKLVLHYLIHKRKFLELDSPIEKLDFYLQDQFKEMLNKEIKEYAKELKVNK